ncbi:MAG TPA: fumarylacetoacetate hydrolase family protein [Streptosporangiaceae bacterium]|jgi:2-keto-4-pentenoate hydratase/2-oxohepta-3-ene-1,7-dioic acid hydratase in catechol pathway
MKLAVLCLADRRRLAIVNTASATAALVPEDLVPGGADPMVAALATAGCLPRLAALAGGRDGAAGLELVALESARICAPVRRPGKIICLASNYQAHMEEAGLTRAGHDPWLFMKPGSSVIGPGEQIRLPYPQAPVDWEVELCAVIGARCRRVAPARALACVGGLTIGNDVSLRQLDQMRPEDNWDSFFSWQQGKWHDTFTSLGPWIVTPDEIAGQLPLRLSLTVNGQPRQSGSTAEMISGLPAAIAAISRITALEPGDVIMTGTPSGVGAASSEFLRPGDLVEAAIEGIGILRNTVAAGEEEPST